MIQINIAYEYYKTYFDKKQKQETAQNTNKEYSSYTEEERRRTWEQTQEEWARRNRAAYRASGRKMRAKLEKNLEPILDANKKFKKSILECNNYNDLYRMTMAYANQIDKMINTMYEYTEKCHRYGMPPNHEYYSETHDENVNYDFPLQKVVSTNIAAIGYDETNKLLYVKFTSGSLYVYYGVVKYIYDGFLVAISKGKYFGEYIKKTGYKYTRLK